MAQRTHRSAQSIRAPNGDPVGLVAHSLQSLLAGAWGAASPKPARSVPLTTSYNSSTLPRVGISSRHGGCPGQDATPADHPSGSVTITDPADPARRGWGTYVFDTQPQRGLSFSAPHPFDDLDTENEAVEAFLALGGRTLLIAGTDRDQNTALAPCDQSSRPYLEADVSHTAESVFQMAFEEIYSSDASTWHLQFHGNANPTLACRDVDVFLSNGIEAAPPTLYELNANIAAASAAAAAGGRSSPLKSTTRRATASFAGQTTCRRAIRLGPAPRAHLCARQFTDRAIAVHPRGATPRRAPRPADPLATPGRNRSVVVHEILATFPAFSPTVG